MRQSDLLSARDQSKLQALAKHPNQANLIEAPGASELSLALAFLVQVLKSKTTWIINPDTSGKIKIEAIQKLLSSTLSKHQTDRYFIIFQAESMTLAAQNALLKTLEEPYGKNYFFLMSSQAQKLLPTVRSRLQLTQLGVLPKTKVRDYFKQQFPDLAAERVRQAEFIASDNFELWQKLLSDSEYFDKYHQMAVWARQLVQNRDNFERLLIVRQIGKDREQAEQVVTLILKIYRTLLVKQSDCKILPKLKLWLETLDDLRANVSVQLTLTRAVLQ